MQWYWWVLIVVAVLALAGIAALLVYMFREPELPKLWSRFECWYGRVNAWANDKGRLEKDVKACRKAGVKGYHIEMMGWEGPNAWTPEWLKHIEEMYKFLLKLCRRNGLRLFVGIINDNMGTGKYGDPGIKLSQVYPQALRLLEIVDNGGPKNVVVQPVGETQTPAGAKFERDCVVRLGGKFPLVYNGGSRPGGVPAGFVKRSWHPFKVADAVPGDAVVVSDTGSIICQLGVGLAGPAHPGALENWARAVRKSGCPVCCYYAFKFDGHDKPAIDALGRAAK